MTKQGTAGGGCATRAGRSRAVLRDRNQHDMKLNPQGRRQKRTAHPELQHSNGGPTRASFSLLLGLCVCRITPTMEREYDIFETVEKDQIWRCCVVGLE